MATSRRARTAVILSCCCLILMLVTLLLCCRNGVPAAQKSGNTIGGDNIDQPARPNVSVSDRMNLNYDNDTIFEETYTNKMEKYPDNTKINDNQTISNEETSIRNLLVSDDYLMVAPDSENAPVKEDDEGESISHQGTGELDSEDLTGSEVPGPISWVGQND